VAEKKQTLQSCVGNFKQAFRVRERNQVSSVGPVKTQDLVLSNFRPSPSTSSHGTPGQAGQALRVSSYGGADSQTGCVTLGWKSRNDSPPPDTILRVPFTAPGGDADSLVERPKGGQAPLQLPTRFAFARTQPKEGNHHAEAQFF
jgi:hypothetical protein